MSHGPHHKECVLLLFLHLSRGLSYRNVPARRENTAAYNSSLPPSLLTILRIVRVGIKPVKESLIELKGERELLRDLPHCVQEQQKHWGTLLLWCRGGVAMTQAERVATVQPLSLDQLSKPAGREGEGGGGREGSGECEGEVSVREGR